MEIFLSLKLKRSDLIFLNKCCIYLWVITLSDITSADGLYILPAAKMGQAIIGRDSKLEWPKQGRPNKVAWQLWSQQLIIL